MESCMARQEDSDMKIVPDGAVEMPEPAEDLSLIHISGNIFYTNLEKEILLLCRELPTEDQEMMASVGRYLREKNREKKRPRPVDLNT